MASLKEQLKKLAVPQNRLQLERKKSSLLFDANDAAGTDREVVFELAISGLNSLVSINKTFVKYEQLLFNKNQINYDRMMQTKEVNQNLNKIIKQYLIEVFPYFLMKSAQKTLEWLVYRYQIHIFNIDDWLMTLFPYHYSNMFVKVLTIMELESPSYKWHWLHSCAKSGIPLPKSVLINHCKKDSVFLHSVFGCLDEFVKVMGRNNSNLNLIFEHCNSIALCLLADSSEITEEIVSAMVQFSIKGLKSKCLIWETCCYTVLASLTANITLKFDNVLMFCQLIAKKHSDELFKEAISCLSVIVANHSQSKYPDNIFENFIFTDTKLLEIQDIAELFDIFPLLNLLQHADKTGFIKELIRQSSEENIMEDPAINDSNRYDHSLAVTTSNVKSCSACLLNVLYPESNHPDDEKDYLISFFLDEVVKNDELKNLIDKFSEKLLENEDINVKLVNISNMRANYPMFADKLKIILYLLLVESIKLCLEKDNSVTLFSTLCSNYLLQLQNLDMAHFSTINKAQLKKMDFVTNDIWNDLDLKNISWGEIYIALSVKLIISAGLFLQKNAIDISTLEPFSTQLFSISLFQNQTISKYLWRILREEMKPQLIHLYTNYLIDSSVSNKDITKEDLEHLELLISNTFMLFIRTYKNGSKLFKKVMVEWFTLLGSSYQILREATVGWFEVILEKVKKRFACYQLMKMVVDNKAEISNDPIVILKLFKQLLSSDSQYFSKFENCLQWFTDYLCSSKPSKKVKLGLLNCLKLCRNDQLLNTYFKMFKTLLDDTNNKDAELDKELMRILFECLNNSQPLNSHNEKYFYLLKRMLTVGSADDSTTVLSVVEHINELSMKAIQKVDNQKVIVSSLINLASTDPLLSKAIKKCFKRIELKHYHVSNLMNVKSKALSQPGLPKLKKIKTEPMDFEKLKLILEVVLSGRQLDDSKEMASLLSSVLSKLSTEVGSNVEYCSQVILTLLSKIICSWKDADKKTFENCINIEALVHCLRNTTNVQTQQHVLLVMAEISTIFPDELLHNIVSIFTFMGDNIIQKDDAYTSQVMTKLIDVALTAVKQLPKDSVKIENILLNVFRVFVDARNHIPRHRALPLFNQLISYNVKEYMWKLIVLIIDSSVRQRDFSKVNQVSGDDYKQQQVTELDMFLLLFSQQTLEVQLITINKMIEFCNSFMQVLQVGSGNIPISVVDPSIKNFPHLCRLLIFHVNKAVLSVISDSAFISRFLQEAEDTSNDQEIEIVFNLLVNNFILYMLNVNDKQKVISSEHIYEKYFPSLLKIIHNILSKLNYLMPVHMFVDVIESLLDHDLPSIQCKGLELMNSKLLQVDNNSSVFKSLVCSLKLVPKLIHLISVDSNAEKDKSVNWNYQKQICFINLKMLCRYYGSESQQTFAKLHEVIIRTLEKHEETNLAVTDSSLLCLADLISVMKNSLFPHLKSIMVPFLQLFSNEQILKSPVSINCVLFATNKLALHLGQFLSPYLDDIIQKLCLIYIQNESKNQWMDRLLNLLLVISKNIDCRVMLPNLLKSYKFLIQSNQHGLHMLFTLFHYQMKNAVKEDIAANMKAILDLVCTFMNIRVDASLLSMEELHDIEKIHIDSILLFVVHLSEVSFRPMFQKLFNLIDDNVDRTLTFYHLVFALAHKLKSIFNIFASCLLKQITSLLDDHNLAKSNKDKDDINELKSSLLIKYILDTVSQCYLHDIDGSFSSGTGDTLFKPIVDQLENCGEDDVLYYNQVTEHLIPCIAQMMQSIKDNDQLFNLHRMICHQTKHDNFRVRLSTVKTIEAIAEGLGASYEALFPEIAPYFAELLEDDSEDVVNECQELKKCLTKIIGDLENFF